MTFQAAGIWNTFYSAYPEKINVANKDIMLPSSVFFDYINVAITIHHSDTVSVAISCSFRPIVIDVPDFFQLYEALTRTEMCLATGPGSSVAIPAYRKWIVKMWHFGVDTIDEYTDKDFEVTFEEGMSNLYRIYTKRTKNSKNKIVRVEHQEYPNQEVAEVFIKKMFPGGRLMGA